MKITILTSCAPFVEGRKVEQETALHSFAAVNDAEVIVLGDDAGVAEICSEYGFKHISDLPIGEYIGIENGGGILMGPAFEAALEVLTGEYVFFINADNILVPTEYSSQGDLGDFLDRIAHDTYHDFCAWNRRHEWPDYHEAYAEDDVTARYTAALDRYCCATGEPLQQIKYGIDLYLWPVHLFEKLPKLPFAIDGWCYDVWLGYESYKLSKNVFYLKGLIDTVHPTHPDTSYHQEHTHIQSTQHNRKILEFHYPQATITELKTPPLYEVQSNE